MNRVPNPSFEQDLSGWSQDAYVATTFARSNSWASDGSWSARLSFNDATAGRNSGWRSLTGLSGIPVIGGELIKITADIKIVTPANGAGIGVYWYNSSGGGVSGSTISSLLTTDGEASLLINAPATAAFMSVRIFGQSNGPFDAYFDNIQVPDNSSDDFFLFI